MLAAINGATRHGPPSPLQQPLQLVYLESNRLVGPAFPDSWIAPNSSLDVWHLSLADNPGLTGTLPPHLPWASLNLL